MKEFAITSFEDSTLASLAGLVLLLPGGLEKKRGWGYEEAQLLVSGMSSRNGG